jgi:LacI family transcriptional regulator
MTVGVRIQDVAEQAGVSPATVSRVLNNRKGISEKTRAKVLSLAAEMGYRPSPNHRTAAVPMVKSIGMLYSSRMPDLVGNPFYGGVLEGLETVLRPDGYQLFSYKLTGDLHDDNRLIQQLAVSGLAGLVFVGQNVDDQDIILTARNSGLPLILVDNNIGDAGVNCVVMDNHRGISEMVKRLVDLGHRRIAFVGGPLSHSSLRERYEAYKLSLASAGIEIDPSLIVLPSNFDGHTAMNTILQTASKPPTAVVVVNDNMAFEVMRALHEQGLRIPDDVSVTGFDDIDMSRSVIPSLTTVSVPKREMGLLAGSRLQQLLGGVATKPVKITVSVEIVMRDSVGPAVR